MPAVPDNGPYPRPFGHGNYPDQEQETLGYALAARRYGKPIRIVVVGPREHVFQTVPGTEWYPDWDTLCAEASWLYVNAQNYDELMRWHAREGGVH